MIDKYADFVITGVFDRARVPHHLAQVNHAVLGLAGEVGEVANLQKKENLGKAVTIADYIDELGDVLWYFTLVCALKGTSIEEVMTQNMKKLKARYPDGKINERYV